jgi:hypothetical protein
MTFIIRKSISVPYVISEFKAHKELKAKLLDAISKTKCTEINEPETGEVISRTDWRINEVRDGAGYFHILKPYLDEHLNEVYSALHYNSAKYNGVWFQQYHKLDRHTFHRHDHTHWTNVYYLELPSDAPGTTMLDPFDYKTEFTPDVYEGYILTTPSILTHCSKPNISSKRKTVIAFNIW